MDRDRAAPGAAYRGETDAAEARVEALERELEDARHKLAALRPRAEPAGPRVLAGLRLLLVGKAIDLGIAVVSMLLLWLLPADALPVGFGLVELVFLGATVVALVGLLRLLPTPDTLRGDRLIRTAIVGESAALLLGILGLLQNLTGLHHGSFAIPLTLLWRVATLLGGVPLLLFYRRLGAALGRGPLPLLSTITLAALLAVQALGLVTTFERVPLLLQLRTWAGLAVAALTVALAAIALSSARTSDLGATAGSTAHDRGRAASGLRLHRAGVLVKILGILVGVILLFAARGARSMEALRALSVLVLTVGLAGGVLAFVGLLRFARVPEETGGQSLAIGAAILVGAALALDLGTAATVVAALAGNASGLLRTAQLLEPVGIALSLPALILLLLSLRRVARHLGEKALAARAAQLAILVGVTAPVAVGMKIPGAARELGLALLALGIPALFLGLYVLARYLGLLGTLSDALER
jgi:hypothetical protein